MRTQQSPTTGRKSHEANEMLHLHPRLHLHAGGRLQPGRAEGQAAQVRGVPEHARRRGILRRGQVRQEHRGPPGVSSHAAGHRIRQGRRLLRAGVQALPLRPQRRGRADLPAADAGLRRQPHLRGGRHRLLQGQRQADDFRSLRRRRD